MKKQEAQRKHLQAFVDRFKAKASKARQAQSRVKMLEKMAPIAALSLSDVQPINIPAPDKLLSPPIVTLDDVSVGYEPGRPILRKLSLRIDDDDRIALLGSNGNGKSTLVKLIAARLAAQEGTVTRAPKLKIAYFAQHQLDELDPDESVYEHLRELMPDASETKVRAVAGSIGFSGQAADTAVERLSGGEKARLMLGLATFAGPHLLILDEPTNHLDIDSRAALIEAINDYPGATILVSHDRHLLDACADRLWLVANGARDAVRRRSRRLPAARADGSRRHRCPSQAGARAQSRHATKRGAATAERRSQAASLRQKVTKAEAEIARLTREIEKLDAALASGDALRQRSGKGRRDGQDAFRTRAHPRAGRRGMAGGRRGAAGRCYALDQIQC